MQWIENYNQGEGSFGDHFDGALDVFQDLIDEGIWKEEDLSLNYSNREDMLFNRRCAMIEDSVLIARTKGYGTTLNDEFALMPFFNPGDQNGWARLYKVCFIGLNKDLEKPENKDKLDLIMKLMDYVSTPEGQVALASDTGGMYSALIGADLPDVPEIKDLITTLNEGRYGEFVPLENAQGALREGLAGMISGEMTKEDVIALVDKQNLEEVEVVEDEVLGVAEKSFSLLQTNSLLTDLMRDWGKTDVALIMDNGKDGRTNGKGITGKIYEGEVTYQDIHYIMPNHRFNELGVLWKAKILGSDLIEVLEYAKIEEERTEGWFYYYSGLKVELDPTAKLGERIQSISLANGEAFDENKLYTVTLIDHSVASEYLVDVEESDQLFISLLMQYIRDQKTITPIVDDRLTVVNAKK